MKSVRIEMQHMAALDVLSLVPADTLARLKSTDAHPELRAYAVAHEGEAEGGMVGGGRMVLQYFREAIRKIHDGLAMGTPLFAGHGETNAHDGRIKVGEVVAKAMKEYGGKLYDIAVAYVLPEHAGRKLDVCSIEAEVSLTHGSGGRASVVDVGPVTGIALGCAGVDVPGFPGATLLTAIQAFAEEHKAMTLSELKKAIGEGGFKPGQLFDADALKADPTVETIVRAEKQTEYEHAKRAEGKLAKEREAWEKKDAEYAATIAGHQAEAVRGKAKGVFDALAAERKLDDKQKAFVERQFARFSTEAKDADALKADLNKFLDGGMTEFAENAKLFNYAPDGGGSGGGSGPASQTGGDVDYSKPENNELLT